MKKWKKNRIILRKKVFCKEDALRLERRGRWVCSFSKVLEYKRRKCVVGVLHIGGNGWGNKKYKSPRVKK